MRILMLSKALVVGAYQKKAEELAALPSVELTVAVPPLWREPGVGAQALERRFTRGYALEVLPIRFNGRHHIHYYPSLGRLVARLRPDVFHIDEESFNLATFLALRAGVRDWYKLEALPGAKQLREIGAVWEPYRSIATWYVWRSRGFVPQS